MFLIDDFSELIKSNFIYCICPLQLLKVSYNLGMPTSCFSEILTFAGIGPVIWPHVLHSADAPLHYLFISPPVFPVNWI